MLDIRFVRENPDAVKENIKKKFQDAKLPLVDEVIELDAEYRAAIERGQRPARKPQQAVQADRCADGPGQEGPQQGCRGRGKSRSRSPPRLTA